jgi:phosphomannomutase
MSIFKAYDIRGIVPEELDAAMAERIARAFVEVVQARRIVVGRDMRRSSVEFAEAACRGAVRSGCEVVDIGMVSTPLCYFAVVHEEADGGLMVTASHNPARYNGFKCCGRQAAPMSGDDGIRQIAERVEDPFPDRAGGKRVEKDLYAAYRDHIRRFVKPWRALKAVVDAGNGMGGVVVERVLDRLPLKITPLYFEPDGSFPHHEANPLKLENLRDLQRQVLAEGADLGVAFDGDADRCAFVDERGAFIPCDRVTAFLAREILAQEGPGAVVYDLRSSWVVPEEIRKAGGTPVRERVGHSFIKGTMRRTQAHFGGELSGHYYFRRNAYCDSAVLAAVYLLNALGSDRRPLSELIAPLRRYHASGELNFRVPDPDAKIALLQERFADGERDDLDGITVNYPDWWFNVRKSNTEPILRLNLESRTEEGLRRARERLTSVLGNPE